MNPKTLFQLLRPLYYGRRDKLPFSTRIGLPTPWVATWNTSFREWESTLVAQDKLRVITALLRKGPRCLQETKWQYGAREHMRACRC